MATEDATLRLCGPCRHFEPAFRGAHACHLGLPLLDGASRRECASFSPFALGEGSQLQSDCCQHAQEEGHEHGELVPPAHGRAEGRGKG